MNDLPMQASDEDLLEQAAEGGWDFLDGAAPSEKGRAQERAETEPGQRMAKIAAILHAQSPEFRELLAWLAKGTLHRTIFLSPLNLPMEQAYAYGQFREGQNAAIFAIFKLIADGRQQAVQPRGE